MFHLWTSDGDYDQGSEGHFNIFGNPDARSPPCLGERKIVLKARFPPPLSVFPVGQWAVRLWLQELRLAPSLRWGRSFTGRICYHQGAVVPLDEKSHRLLYLMAAAAKTARISALHSISSAAGFMRIQTILFLPDKKAEVWVSYVLVSMCRILFCLSVPWVILCLHVSTSNTVDCTESQRSGCPSHRNVWFRATLTCIWHTTLPPISWSHQMNPNLQKSSMTL